MAGVGRLGGPAMTRDERADVLMSLLIERASSGRPMADLLEVAEPRLVAVTAELLVLSLVSMAGTRAALNRRATGLSEQLLGELASQAARIFELEERLR